MANEDTQRKWDMAMMRNIGASSDFCMILILNAIRRNIAEKHRNFYARQALEKISSMQSVPMAMALLLAVARPLT